MRLNVRIIPEISASKPNKRTRKTKIVHPAENWFFDLDNTLYQKPDLFKLIDERINRFVMNFLGVNRQKAESIRKAFFVKYGTTLRGLIKNFSVDPESYLDYVHDIDVKQLLKYDFSLKSALENIKAQKFIFTNASKRHAEAVLSSLGIRGCFEDIFDTAYFGYHAKPEAYTFSKIANGFSGKNIMVDDYPKNIEAAKKSGFCTVLVGKNSSDYADIQIEDIHNISIANNCI